MAWMSRGFCGRADRQDNKIKGLPRSVEVADDLPCPLVAAACHDDLARRTHRPQRTPPNENKKFCRDSLRSRFTDDQRFPFVAAACHDGLARRTQRAEDAEQEG